MISTRYRMLLAGLLTATTLGTGAAVYAQSGGPLWDRSQLPETKGIVKQYTLTPRGDVDGLVLNDGTEVKLPPHLTAQVVFAIRPGDAVTVRGLKARALPLVDAASVTNDAGGATVVDDGPPGGPGRMANETTLSGRIATTLHGKQGEVNGALLENGTVLRLPPPEASRMQALLQRGQTVSMRGGSLVTPLGTVIDVTAIGTSPDSLIELADGPPRGAWGGPLRGPEAFGPPPPPPDRGPRGGPAGFGPPPPPRG
jgi:hypothetical protein